MSNSFVIPCNIACQSALSMGFPMQEYWNGLPFHSPGYLPNPGNEPMSAALASGFFTTKPPGKPLYLCVYVCVCVCVCVCRERKREREGGKRKEGESAWFLSKSSKIHILLKGTWNIL